MTRTYGPAYDPAIDGPRIDKQHERIREYMRRVEWKTLREIESVTGDPQSSISAQLQHLRKLRCRLDDEEKLIIEFDAEVFDERATGLVALRFSTDKARLFLERLT